MVLQLLINTSFIAMAGGGEQGGSSMIQLILMMAVIFGIFYFLVIRPQQKQKEEHQTMIESLSSDDRVITAGGIHGQIKSVSEETVDVQIAQDIKITVNKNAISTVKGDDDNDES